MKQIKVTEELLKKWADMTDNNEHIEVRIEIAKFFKIDKINDDAYPGWEVLSAFETEKKLHEYHKCGNLSAECIVTRVMFNMIAHKYGQEISDKVSKCL
jgi:hypothetical protein